MTFFFFVTTSFLQDALLMITLFILPLDVAELYHLYDVSS